MGNFIYLVYSMFPELEIEEEERERQKLANKLKADEDRRTTALENAFRVSQASLISIV